MKNFVTFLGERHHASGRMVRIGNAGLFHKALAAEVRDVVFHAGVVAVVGELGEITRGHDPKLADLRQGVHL